MNKLSDTARNALAQCYATRGKHRGQLLAKCPTQYGPKANKLAAARLAAQTRANLGKGKKQMAVEHFVVGLSEDVQAEYSTMSKSKYTVLTLFDNEPVATEGYHSITQALLDLNDVPKKQITVL